MAKGNKDVKRGIVLYIDGKAVQNNARAIQGEMRNLKREIDGCTVGSEEYIQKVKQYKLLDAELQRHKANLKGIETQTKANAAASQNWLQKGVAMFNQYSVAILGFTAAFTGVAMKISEFRKKNMEKESSQANLKALTGLDDSSIEWLTNQAEKLSTTMDESGLRVKKSAQEILEAYTMVGSKKPELLQDKEALNAVTIEAMRLAEAAKIDLTEAVAGVTLAMNQYGAAADEASRYVNVLAAGSKMGAVGVATQTESIVKAGVAASTAKVPIEQLVGVLETLGERGIEGSLAGTQLKTFLLKLESGAEETRPSVVGLQQALETLAEKNLDATEMTKMFGLESYTAAQALISSVDKVKYYTDAVTGTNIAVEQAAINSDTMEAKMAQLKNQINETGMALAQDLAPVFSRFTNLATKFVMALPPLVTFLKKYGMSLTVAITALTLYTLRTQIATRATVAWNAVMTFFHTQFGGFRAALAAYHVALKGATNAQIEMTAAVKGTNIVTQAGVIAVGVLKAAYYALTFQVAACTRTMKMLKVALAESGWGLVILAIGAAAAAVVNYNEKKKEQIRLEQEAKEAEKALYKEYDEARARVKMLRKTASDYTATLEEREAAIKKLQELAPEYQASISEEGRLIETNTGKLDEYLKRLKENIALEAYKSKLIELYQQQADAEEAAADASAKYWDIRQQNTLQGYKRDGLVAKTLRALGLDAEGDAKNALDKANNTLADINNKIDEAEKRQAELAKSLVGEGGTSNPEPDPDPDSTKTPTKPDGNKTDDRIKKEIAAVELEVKKKQNILRQSYVEGKIDRRKYNAEMERLEMERLQRMLEIAGLEPEKVAEIQGKMLEMQMKTKEELDNMSFDKSADEDLKRYNEQTQKIEDELLERISVIDSSLQLGIIAQEEYNEKIAEVWEKYDADMESAHEAYTKKVLERKDETKEELKGLAKTFEDAGLDIKELAEDISDSLCKGVEMAFDKERAILKKILKSILSIIIDAIEKMVIAAQVENSLLTITGIGTGAGLANLAKLVGIKIAFAALKEAVNSFDVGGYTGIGRWDEPAGIVHKGEFVANRHALANPAVKAVLDVVDNAQRRGTVANLTAEDIRAVASLPGINASPGQYMAPGLVGDGHSRELMALMEQCIDAMTMVKDRFNEPIIAETYATGKGGTMTAQELVEKMKKNASRKR